MSEAKAATTRTVLVMVLVLVVTALTAASLLIVWHQMRQQVRTDFTLGLQASALAFKQADQERLNALQREANLLADLPSLKALMTTNDDRTIEDGATGFWKTSGRALFALADRELRVRALYTRDLSQSPGLRRDLSAALLVPAYEYVVSGSHLFRYTVAPVYFGAPESGTLLGYVVIGYAVDSASLAEMSRQVDAVGLMVSGHEVLASSIAISGAGDGATLSAVSSHEAQALLLGGERYLGFSQNFSVRSTAPLSLVFLKSLSAPAREIHDIARLLLIVGGCTVLLGTGLMLLVARRLTRPLEELTRRVRAFGSGETQPAAANEGTREVRQLTADFAAMQGRIRDANRMRLESERLATIGSMASSVSHDLRHYLASIYANAEFLAAGDITDSERAEFLDDIRSAVLGTTEMLESLMIFGRTGESVRHAPELLEVLLRRAMTQVRTHPDAAGVSTSLIVQPGPTEVTANGKQLERALYNLLLNACQAARIMQEEASVIAELVQLPDAVAVRVTDNGSGVPDMVQKTLFDPFVSEGKQNGTGLGLTLCRCIAEEHGGYVELLRTSPGSTVFQLSLPRIGSTEVELMAGRELREEV